MELREKLLKNPKVPDSLVDDVIHRAQGLKDAETAKGEGASVAEIQAVAAELGIEPEHVQDALALLRSEAKDEKAEEALQRGLAAQKAQSRRAMLRRFGIFAGAGLALVAALTGAMGMVGRSSLQQVNLDRAQAQASLVVQLDRQASLIPQLVALAGGESSALDQAQESLKQAETVDERMQASQELSVAAAQALAGSQMDQGTRLNLQYELTGATNRITTEQRRYNEAEAAYLSAASRLPAQV
ncbi:MAG: hypothetical protein ACI9VR_002584, partial [Cognaticolwellia sp.]